MTAIGNSLAFWKREELGLELVPGADEVSLALIADAWSRTYRSQAVTYARTGDAQESLSGLRIIPDQVATSWPGACRLPPVGNRPAEELERVLRAIETRYGAPTADFVAMQLEYPRHIPGH